MSFPSGQSHCVLLLFRTSTEIRALTKIYFQEHKMAWRHWFIRHREIINDVNNEASIINSSTANELLAWSLEPRMLFDGAIAATVHETATAEAAHTETAVSGSDAKTVTQSDASLALTHSVPKENNSVTPANHDATATAQPNASNATDIAAPAPDALRHEVVFIDTSIKDYQTLAAGVGPGIDVVLVDGNKDGLQQIAEWAAGHGGYDAMHIFSHGSEGKINLGSGVLNSTTLSTDAVQTALAVIGKALTRDGDILLYGCDVGANSSGDALLAGIARATGADVAASSNATGSSLMGGDWTLEKNVGTVDALALHVDAYHDLLTQVTFTSSDPDMDYTHDSVTRPVEGYNITFATSPGGFLGADSSYGNEGLYAYSGVDSVTRLTISSPVGTTFDLNSMNVGATTGTLHFSVQYGNGTTSSFDVAVSSSGYSTLSSFPSALNDITSVTITSQDFSAFESITITDVKASVTSAAPVIGNLNGDSVSFTEGGAPVLLDAGSNATLTDSDSADFNGGNVTVSFSGNGVSGQDVLSVQNQGTSAGQIGLSGTSVTWGGVSIGTLSGGTNGNSLVITLNASATPAAVQGLLHALTWQNTNNSEPSTLTRSISVTVNDGDGATSVASTVSVNVTGVNDAPTLTTTTSTPTFTENGNAVPLFSGSVVSTVESGQSIDQLTLTVSNISNGASEILTVDGTAIALTNGVSGNTLTNGIAYSVSVSGGTATLTLSSAAGISTSTTASLINGITYRNSSEAPTAANRVVTLTGVRDNGGTSNGGVNTTVLSFASTVSVEAVNDAPSISGPTTISVTEDTSKSLTGITFSDVDAGNATVAAAFSVNSGTLSAVSSAGVIVGTSGSTLLTLSGTIADINAFIAAGKLSFLPASNSTTSATLNININDNGNSGSGGPLTTSAAITLSISAVNDAPVNNIPASQTVQQDGSLVFSSGNGNAITVSDVDVGNNEMKVTLTAANGLLTLGSTAGLTLQNGSGSGDGTMTFLGTQAAINAALNGLIFTPNSGYNGSASVQIITTDQGFTGSGGTLSDTDTINIAVSSNAPSITSITSGTANGVYGIGSTIFVNVNFNAAVTVDTTGGTPTLLLETGSVDRLATYVSGSGTDTLVFSYKVQSGDRNTDLDYASTAALALNGSTIRDSGSNNAQLTLATPGTAGSLGANASVIIDGVRPTATVVVSDTALRIGETSLVTVIFSEAVTGFTNADLTINNGTLSAVSSSDGGITWTATFTPTTNISDTTNIITLDNTGVTDAAGNAGTGTTDSNNYIIDTQRPTATVVVSDPALSIGETSVVTITFSEAVTGFTIADLSVNNGSLSNLTTSDNITWTAILTPLANISDTSNLITLDNTGVTDAAGNTGTGTTTSNNYSIDTLRPTATVVVGDTALKAGETSLVTITFSEAVTGFTSADLTVSNGTLSAVSSADGGITWTATFTPAANISDTTNIITLDNSGVVDLAGNTGTGTTISNNYSIDTQRPTATIVVSDTALRIGQTSLVTVTFSEAVTGFTNADLTINNGTLSAVSSADGGITWTAILTPAANISDTSNLITLDNSGVADAAGNAGTGTTDSNNYSIDTQRPGATIVMSDTALGAGETSTVTITFSEAVSGFSNADLTVSNGTLSAVSSADGGITWTAIFTPTAGSNSTGNVITLDNSGVVDAAGNSGVGTTNSSDYSIDTQRPTATVVMGDTALKAGETSLVTITFSEAVSGFSNADLSVSNGTLSTVSSADGGVTWTATFTPRANTSSTSNVISLNNSGVSDMAGNTGLGSTDSNNYSIDTQRPTATIVISDTTLNIGETSLVTITFSEAVTGFTSADLTVSNGMLSAVSSADGGITWTTTFTPTANISSTNNVITLNSSGVTDLAGNTGAGTTDSNNYSIDTQRPGAIITLSDTTLKTGERATVTITFSEAVTGLDLNDLRVMNGTLSNLATIDGGITWTATFTPAPGTTAATNQISLNNSLITDLAGNRGEGNTQSADYSIDSAPPRVTGLTTLPATSPQTLDYQLDFSEAVSGLDASDFSIVTSGNVTANISSIIAISPTQYVIHLTGISGNGTVQLSLNTSGTGITDNAGNAISGGFSGAVFETQDPEPTSPDTTLPSRGYDSQPLTTETAVRTGGQSQLVLLTPSTPGATLPGAPAESTSAYTSIFHAANQNGAVGASVLATVFGNNGVTHYEPAITRTQVNDLNRPVVGRSTLASVFGDLNLPGVNALEVFSGNSWQHVDRGSIAPLVAPASVFGAPVFSMQLQQLNDDESQQLASLEGALQNIKPSV